MIAFLRRTASPVAILACLWMGGTIPAGANPSGPNVRHGDLHFDPRGDTLRIIQRSQHGIIDWNSFSIRNGETTRFIQPGTSSATLNRVTGASQSNIDGKLLANGRIFLLNPNGILVGRTGVVDVAGFTASTLDMDDAEFLAGGDFRLRGPSQAAVVNLGSISAFDSDVFLVAASVVNSGSIDARNGTVGLAAGNDVLIQESGHERVFVRGASGSNKADGVVNEGTVRANIAELKSHGGNLYGMAVRNEGRVSATAVSREGGQIFLRAGGGRVRSTGSLVAKRAVERKGGEVTVDAGTGGSAEIGGTVDAGGADGSGGAVYLLGETIDVFEGSVILADGDTGGGRIQIGGGKRGLDPSFQNATDVTIGNGAVLNASAHETGDGGLIIVFASRDLTFHGRAEARGGSEAGNGGFVELSGKRSVSIPSLVGAVDLSAPAGKSGTLLFDPNDIDILAGAGEDGLGMTEDVDGVPTIRSNTLFAEDIADFLEFSGSLVIETDLEADDEALGNITVFTGAEILWSSDNSLSILAEHDVRMEYFTRIESTGNGAITLSGKHGVFLGGNFGSGILVEDYAAVVDIVTGGDITIGNSEVTESGGVFIDRANVESTGGSVAVTGYSSSTDEFPNAGQFIHFSRVAANGDVTLSGFDTTPSAGGGLWVIGSNVSSAIGTVSLSGTSDEGAGVSILSSQVGASGGNITVTGTSSGMDAGDYGVLLEDLEGEQSTFLTTSANGVISLVGETTATGSFAVLLAGGGEEAEVNYITGDGSQNLSVTSQGGAVELNHVTADDFSFTLVDGAAGDFYLGNSLINSFAADGADAIEVVVGGSLKVGDVTSSSDVLFVLENGNLETDGLIDAAQSVSFVGWGEDQVFQISTPIVSPSVSFEGGSNPLKVETEGTLNLTGYTFTNVSEVRGVGVFNSLITTDADTTVVLTTLFEDAETNPTQAEIDGNFFVGYDSITGGAGSDTFDIQIAEGEFYDGFLDGGGGNDEFLFSAGGGVSYIVGGSGTDTIGYASQTGPVFVDVDNQNASQVDFFEDVESFVGSQGNADEFFGTYYGDQVSITGDGMGTLGYFDGELTHAFAFDGFETISTLEGGDTFSIELSGEDYFSGTLLGGDGDDEFIFTAGGGVAAIDGQGDSDTMDFSSFTTSMWVDLTSMSATQVDSFAHIESFMGGSAVDAISGTAGADAISIFGNGTGSIMALPGEEPGLEPLTSVAVDFTGFEEVSGADGDDEFEIALSGESSFSGTLFGGSGDDTFVFQEGGHVDAIEGGADFDTFDYSVFTSSVWVDLGSSSSKQVAYFDGLENFVGGSGADSFIGTDEGDAFLLTASGAGEVEYEKQGPPAVTSGPLTAYFSGFETVDGFGGGDFFTVSVTGGSFSGSLLGSGGDDIFYIQPGDHVDQIDGGEGLDSLDFGSFASPVTVDLDLRAATQVDSFVGIEHFAGGTGLDSFLGTPNPDIVTIDSSEGGRFRVASLGLGLPAFEEFTFAGFEAIEGLGSADIFTITNASGSAFNGKLGGGAGNDIFIMLPGGGVAAIDGGTEFDSITYAAFTTPVVADFRSQSGTQVGLFANMERLVGGRGIDTLIGTNNADIFRVESDNGGRLNAGFFQGFELLQGAAGNDHFQFFNQATVQSVFGGGGVDTLTLDDSTLGGTNTYTISANSISRNPTYNFNGIETLRLFLGPGDDTVITRGNGTTQVLHGGGGTDFLDMGPNVFLGGRPIVLGSSKIFATGFEGPFDPNADPILTQQQQNVPRGGGNNGNGAAIDQYSAVLSEFAVNAFSASLASAVAAQAVVIQVDGSQYLLQAPASLDGTFTIPPEGVIQYLKENLDPDVWAELADAIDFEGAAILVMSDGGHIIDLSEATPAEVLGILRENLLAGSAQELLESLQLALVIPVTSLDGAVSIVAVPVAIDPQTVALLAQLLAEEPYSELTTALDGE